MIKNKTRKLAINRAIIRQLGGNLRSVLGGGAASGEPCHAAGPGTIGTSGCPISAVACSDLTCSPA